MGAYTELVKKQRDFYLSGATRDIPGRKRRIEKLKKLLLDNKKAIDDAVYEDLHRRPSEISDVDMALSEVEVTLKNMDEWLKPRKFVTTTDMHHDPSTDELFVVPESLGVVLIIAPWNVPLVCSTSLIQAFAAGNTVILKPSELNPHYAPLFHQIVSKYFDEKEFAVVEGAVEETTELLKERFDHIVYTGGPPVAKIIMAAAAKHLTPVTFELGGKNPVYVDDSADLDKMAKGLVWAKLFNAGQACICADYILTTPAMKDKVICALGSAFDEQGDLSKVPINARIINERHFKRLTGLLEKTRGRVVYKGKGAMDPKEKFIPFHLVEVDSPDDVLMEEEIFGPITPIMTVPNFDAALKYINRHEKPLSAYIFTEDAQQARRFVLETSSGGVTVNWSCAHMGCGLPFGGVGNSGMGRLMGKYAFDTLTHEKPICVRGGMKANFAF